MTLLRLLLLPIGGILLYGGATARWAALVFMTILGCTDFIDGWMARRYGTTELGRLMDPIADKVFIVVSFMPFIDLGWLQGWQVALLLSREFVVTALRSTYERRHISPRTAFLAKVKAWAQMAGGGVMFLLQVVPKREMLIIISVGAALPVLMTLLRYILTGYFWRVTFIFAGWVSALLVPFVMFGPAEAFQFLVYTVIGITWLSGWGYIAPVFRLLASGNFDVSDWIRLLGALALPVLLIAAQVRPNLPAWTIILTMSLEMAIGGLDNLLCVHNAQSSAAIWALRVGLIALLTGLALYIPAYGGPFLMMACVVSLLGTAAAFYRSRRYYLDQPQGATALATTTSD